MTGARRYNLYKGEARLHPSSLRTGLQVRSKDQRSNLLFPVAKKAESTVESETEDDH